MITLIYIDVFLIGLIFGSFINTIIYRLYEKKDFIGGRSTCPHCGRLLGWGDLIPLVSFFVSGGKCRYCGHDISWQYPLVELTTAILFLAVLGQNIDLIFDFLSFGILKLVFLFYVIASLIIIFVYDWKHYLVPNKVIYPLIGVTFLWYVIASYFFQVYTLNDILTFLVVAAETGAFFWIINVLTQGKGMGMGDVKLGFFMGLFLGLPEVLIALLIGFFNGAIIGVFLMLFGGKKLKDEIPFAPFLISGTFMVMFFGDYLLSLDLFGF